MDWTHGATSAYPCMIGMWLNPIVLRGECGAPLLGCIKQVGLTPQHEVVMRWSCPACKRKHDTAIALADCWRACPELGAELQGGQPSSDAIPERGAGFLHSSGMKLPEDDGAKREPEAPRRCA